MSKFQEDVQLLGELQSLIDEADKTVNMTPQVRTALKSVLGAKAQGAMPEAQKKAAHRIEVLSRAKARLEELMEQEYKGGR